MTDPLIQRVAQAFRRAAVEGRLPSSREPLPFLTLAEVAVTAMGRPTRTEVDALFNEWLRDIHGDQSFPDVLTAAFPYLLSPDTEEK